MLFAFSGGREASHESRVFGRLNALFDGFAQRLLLVPYRGGMTTLLALEKAPKRFVAAVEIAGLTDFVAYMSYKPDERRMEVAREKEFGGKRPRRT